MKLSKQRHFCVVVMVISYFFLNKPVECANSTEKSEKNNKILRKSLNTPKILGGRAIEIGYYPSIVALLQRGYQVCGGTIIGSKVVITAAHCVYGVDRSEYTIRAGSSYRSRGGLIYKLDNLYMHPNYDNSFYDYDFAIIITEKKFQDYQISKLALAPVPPTSRVWVAGWGASESFETTDQLHRADLMSIKESKCKEILSVYKITRSMMCAINPKGGIDTCTGDSGGPLFYENQLAGVTSWGVACGERYPGVYSNVTHALQWIHKFLD